MSDILKNCPDCGVAPGSPHEEGCDIEICSVCGNQRLGCGCIGHNKYFSRWTGVWPGEAEANFLNIDLNTFYMKGYNKIFFIEPKENKHE